MIDNRSVGCNWLSIMKLQSIPNPIFYCCRRFFVYLRGLVSTIHCFHLTFLKNKKLPFYCCRRFFVFLRGLVSTIHCFHLTFLKNKKLPFYCCRRFFVYPRGLVSTIHCFHLTFLKNKWNTTLWFLLSMTWCLLGRGGRLHTNMESWERTPPRREYWKNPSQMLSTTSIGNSLLNQR